MSTTGADAPRRNIHLTLGINDSDHVRDLVSGRVQVDGIDLTCLLMEVEEIFFRFTRNHEWDVSELSFGKYCAMRAAGDDSLIAIPVFPSRSFRHSAIYVRPDGPVNDPTALAGARIGFPEWTVTATVYARALLQHEYGLDLTEIDWVQGGTNEPGRRETLPVKLPAGVRVRAESQRSLNEMLIAGDIDAIVAPHTPSGFDDGSGDIVRLFSDWSGEEQSYYKRTGIFPIMHLVVIRKEVDSAYPWAAANLFKAFLEAKDRSVKRMLDSNAPLTPVPWGPVHVARVQEIMGPDVWPYGLEASRTTIEAFLRYAYEQGVCARKLECEELFAPSVLEFFRV
ncbi:MAG TPA: hypothetical protein VNT22_07375 [Baekduia sp.]|nr:hypothetical protein [Baekduia sp.]